MSHRPSKHFSERPPGRRKSEEEERLAVLGRLGILDTPPAAAFDRVAELATEMLGAPIGLVSFVGTDRQWHKATAGLQVEEVPREHSFCTYAIEEPGPMIVEDLARDQRFADNPYVEPVDDEALGAEDCDGPRGLRFYGGVPFTVKGQRLGTVCMLDHQPRSLSATAVRQLSCLSGLVEEELRARLTEGQQSGARASASASTAPSDARIHPEAEALRTTASSDGDDRGAHDGAAEGGHRYRTALQHSPVLFAQVDTDLRYEWIFNPHGDFDPATVRGKRDDELDSGPGIEALVDLKRRALEQAQQQRTEITFERSDGLRTYDITATPLRDGPDGEVIGLTTAALDVTQQKQTERQLRQVRRWLEACAEAAGAALFVVAPDYSATRYVNEVAEERYGVPRQTLVSDPMAWMRHVHPADRSALEERIEQQRQGQASGPVQQEFRLHHPTEGDRWLRVYVRPIEGPEGEVQELAGIGVDVTKEKRRAEQLRRQNDLFRRAQKLAKVGAWEVQVSGGSVEPDHHTITEEALAIHGLSREADLPPEQSLSFYHPEDRPTLREAFRRAVKKHEPYDLELRLEGADGTDRWVRTRGEPQTEGGDVVRVRGTIQDITERKRQERERRDAEARFRIVVENTKPVAFMLDADGIFRLAEGEDLEVLGMRPEDTVGESVFELFADYPTVTDHIRRALDGEDVEYEVELDGVVLRNWASPFYREGRVAGCIGMATDVTERRRMEQDLREREERLRFAQQMAHLGYWCHDLRTEELEWSSETRRIFGWGADKDITYEAFMEAVVPEDRSELKAAQEAALAGEAPLDIEYRIRRPSGEERVLYERGRLRTDEDGERVALMGAVQDVTQEVRRREQLQEAKEEAEEADRIKAALLSNMNHELRTPLTSILTFSRLIDQNPDSADQFIDRILGGGRRLLYTLNTVMEFAELEGEVHADSPTSDTERRCQLDGTVRSVASDYREKAQKKGLDLEVEVEKGGPVYLDAHLIKQVLTHLLDNSVKFTEEGGVSVKATAGADAVTLQVDDTGVGIAPDFLPRVFDEFAQASTGLARRYEGNGLGLTVTKRLVDRAGGDIEIESEVGEGTWVTVRLPTGA
jgi:PAS domain S-box-containing protein